MKKFSCIVLCLILCLQMLSCVGQVKGETTEAAFDYEGYKKLELSSSADSKKIYIGVETDVAVIELSVPDEWSCSLKKDRLAIYRDGVEIGEAIVGAPIKNDGLKVYDKKSEEKTDVKCEYSVISEKLEPQTDKCYRRAYTYTYDADYGKRTVSLTVNYNELSDKDADALFDVSVTQRCTDSKIGSLYCFGTEDREILILGNSFIATSKIGSFLYEMLDGTQYRATAVSRGMGSVSKDSWSDYREYIKHGRYYAVFLCGFYSDADVQKLNVYIDACKQSNTRLVLFPAHNETEIDRAMEQYPELSVLHWKNEINMLMKELLIDKSAFCINDSHKHSTPLAGYVGAQMIYRALTDELPPEDLQYTAMPREDIENYLWYYMTTGHVLYVPRSATWMLK